MGLSSSASGAGVTYFSGGLTCSQSCTFTSHFYGTIMGTQGTTCLSINNNKGLTLPSSATGHSHNVLCNMFFPSGTKVTACSGSAAIFGCLIG